MPATDPKAKEAAINIRTALQNLNELVRDAHALEVLVTYEVRRPKHYEPGNPMIFAIISQEI